VNPASAPSGPNDGVRLNETMTVRVPASTANLGPGYDAIGLALGLYDEVDVTATGPGPGADVEVEGEGAVHLPLDDEHLVVRALRGTLTRAGVRTQPRLRLRCRNAVPHGRGLGSSATAIVTGVMAGRALLADPDGARRDGGGDLAVDEVDEVDEVVHVASAMEGHPDTAAASVLGGPTVGWCEEGRWRAVRLEPHPDVEVIVCMPATELSTARARAMLPDRVPHSDAAFTAGRAALLVQAVTRSPHLLLPATEDRLHQQHREPAMPGTLALVERLRAAGHAAVVSGAGPSVLVLTTRDRADAAAAAVPEEWEVLRPGIDLDGARSWNSHAESGDVGSQGRPTVLQ
jgi:homoserine kinase